MSQFSNLPVPNSDLLEAMQKYLESVRIPSQYEFAKFDMNVSRIDRILTRGLNIGTYVTLTEIKALSPKKNAEGTITPGKPLTELSADAKVVYESAREHWRKYIESRASKGVEAHENELKDWESNPAPVVREMVFNKKKNIDVEKFYKMFQVTAKGSSETVSKKVYKPGKYVVDPCDGLSEWAAAIKMVQFGNPRIEGRAKVSLAIFANALIEQLATAGYRRLAQTGGKVMNVESLCENISSVPLYRMFEDCSVLTLKDKLNKKYLDTTTDPRLKELVEFAKLFTSYVQNITNHTHAELVQSEGLNVGKHQIALEYKYFCSILLFEVLNKVCNVLVLRIKHENIKTVHADTLLGIIEEQAGGWLSISSTHLTKLRDSIEARTKLYKDYKAERKAKGKPAAAQAPPKVTV